MPRLTLGWLTLINASPAEVITAAAQAAFKSVSIRITGRKLSDPFPAVIGNKPLMREMKQRLDDGGLRLSNTSIYHLSQDVTLDHLRPAIDASAELGAEIIVVTCTDADHDRWVRFMQTYCEAAAGSGLKLAIEFVPYSEAKSIDVAVDLVQRTGAPNFGLLIDPLHLSRSGGTPADIARVDPARITFVQLCDAVKELPPYQELPHEARSGRLYPGDGALPLHDFLDALPDGIEIECEVPRVDYAGLPPVEQARRAGEATRAFLDRYSADRGKPMWD